MNKRRWLSNVKRIISAVLVVTILFESLPDMGIEAQAAATDKWYQYDTPWDHVVATACGNGKFLALDYSGNVYASEYGTSWEMITEINGELIDPYNVQLLFCQEYFYLVSPDHATLYSKDGIEWQPVNCKADGIFQISYSNGKYYLVSGERNFDSYLSLIEISGTAIYTSDNGVDWEELPLQERKGEVTNLFARDDRIIVTSYSAEGYDIMTYYPSGELVGSYHVSDDAYLADPTQIFYIGGYIFVYFKNNLYRSVDGTEWEDCGYCPYFDDAKKDKIAFCKDAIYVLGYQKIYCCDDLTAENIVWTEEEEEFSNVNVLLGDQSRILAISSGRIWLKRLPGSESDDDYEKKPGWVEDIGGSTPSISGNELPMQLTENISVSGNCILEKNIDLNGKTLTIEGDLIQSQGDIYVNGGQLVVCGNYRTESGLLFMQNKEDIVTIQGNYENVAKSDLKGCLTEGIMQVGGDFTVSEEAGEYAFCPGRNHTVELNGSGKQTVTTQKDNGISYFNNLILSNNSREGIAFVNDPYVEKQVSDNSAKIDGRIAAGKETTFSGQEYGGSVVYVESVKLTQPLTIGGDFYVQKRFELETQLTVNGPVHIEKNVMEYNHGTLTAEGDLIIDSSSHGMHMTHGDDTAIVKGSMTYGNDYDYRSVLNTGTIYVAGNVSLNGGYQAEKEHKLVLNGNSRQVIEVSDSSYNRTVIGTLELQNYSTDGVWSKNILRPAQGIYNGCKLNYGEGNTEGITGFTLEEDQVIDGDVYLMDGTLDLNGYSLTINGSLTQASGTVDVNGGTLHIGGDYRMLFIENGSYSSKRPSQGILKMKNPDDHVIVDGKMEIGTNQYLSEYLTEGILELHGDFHQMHYNNFAPTGNHVTYLTGAKDENGNQITQYALFESSYSKFNTLLLNIEHKKYTFNKNGNKAYYNELRYTEDITAPTQVTNLKAECSTYLQADVSWDAASDNVDVKGYAVYRNGEKIADTVATSYQDAGLAPGTYTYQVYAYDEAGNIAEKSPEADITIEKDVTPPEKVTGLNVYTRTGSSVTLKWDASEDDYEVTGYDVYRDGKLIAEDIKELTFKDNGLVMGKQYEYSIVAKDIVKNQSEKSSSVTGEPALPEIKWTYPAENTQIGGSSERFAIQYTNVGNSTGNHVRIEYYDSDSKMWVRVNETDLKQESGNNATFDNSYYWNIPDFQKEEEMEFRFTVIDADGNETSKTVTYFVDRLGPTMNTVLQAGDDNSVAVIKWEKSEAEDTIGYRVERRLKGEESFEQLAALNSDTVIYRDNTGEIGKTYEYRVYAIDEFYQKGNVTECAAVTIGEDKEAPKVVSLTSFGTRIRQSVNIYACAQDNRGLSGYRFYVRKSDAEEWTLLGENKTALGGAGCEWDTTRFADGYYYFKAVAYDAAGNETKEPFIHSVTIDNTGIAKIRLQEWKQKGCVAYFSWEGATEDDLAGYRLQYSDEMGWNFYCNVSKEKTEYVIKGLSPEKDYTFRVVGYDTIGNESTQWEEVQFTTTADDAAPVIVSATPKDGAYPDITELTMEVNDNVGIDYGVFSYSYDGKNFYTIKKVSVAKLEEREVISCEWNTKGLREGNVTVRFAACDMSGISDTGKGEKATERIYTIDRTAPAELKAPATSVSENGVDVSWTKAGEEDVVYYRLYRSDRDGKNITLIADNVTDTFCHDETADSEKVYLYYVSAVDGAGNESVLSEGTPGGALPDTEPPERVTGLAIKTRTGSSVTLTWKKSQDNYATTGYNIYRDGNLIAENVAATEYKDTGLTENTLYTYTVTALDKAGNESDESAPKDSAVFMPKITEILPKDYALLGGESVTVTVRFENGGNSVGNHVKLEYLDPETDNWIPITETDLPQQNFDAVTLQASCPWTLPLAEEDLYLDVRATVTDADGNTDEKTVSYEIDRTAPFAPEGLKAEESAGTINLTWKPSDSPDAAGYYLYRREADETEFTKIADISGRMTGWYTDRNVTENVTYTYRISAYDGFGREGDASALTQACAQTDTAAPQIKAVAPQAGKVNRTVKITVTAYDNRGVEKVKLYIKPDDSEEWALLSEVLTEREKNQNGQTASGGENDDTAIYEWDTTGQSGSFYVKAVAYDHAGNESRNEFLRHYTVDNEGPAKIIMEDCTATSTAVQLIWKDAEEEDFGYFVVEEKTEEGWKTKETITDRLGCTITGLAPGTSHTYRVAGYDILDNRGEPSEEITLTTTEDNINPMITQIDPAGDRFRDSIPLAMHVTDNAGVTRGRFSYTTDKETYTELAVMEADKASADRDFTYEWDISALPEKEVTVRFEAWDEAGNKNSLTEEEKEIEKTFTIDHTAPGKITGLAVTSNEGSIGLVWDEMTEEDIDHFVILRSDAEDGEYTVVENNCRTKNYYDTNVTRGHTYYYRAGAVDVAGNAGEYSDPAFATVLPDREAPTLHGISPLDGEVLGMHAGLTVLATDNAELERIIVEYRQKDGLALWNTIGTEEVTGQEGYAEIEWNTEGLQENTVYEVRAIAVDAAGNESEAVTREYTLDLTPPVMPLVTTESGSWRIGLDYGVNTDETITKYEIYRKALGEEEYTCIQSCTDTAYEDTTTETDLIYYYKVRAYDEHGNYTESMPVHDYADDTDTIPPVAELPENVMAVTGLAIALDATASTDNVRIMKYEWNFGDGKTAKGARPKHTYKEAGAYTISLTVTDAAGNSDVTTTTAIVLDGENNGITTLTVLDTQGVGIGGATVYVRTGNGENEYIKTATDSAGRVDIATKAGVYEVSAYKEGYLPADDTIRVSNYEKLESRLVLKSGEVVTGCCLAH